MHPQPALNEPESTLTPGAGDALLLIDVQRDFLPGGALAVPSGERVIPVLNRYIARFQQLALPIVATRDWHPANHSSFVTQGGRWPVHCVAGTPGAAFADGLHLPPDVHVVSKATARDEEFSAFAGAGLAEWLAARNVRRLFAGGLATDYCVFASVCDAVRLGFSVILLTSAIAAVNERDGEAALGEMKRLGVVLL